MLHWFDEAQFNENGEFVYTYLGLGDIIATTTCLLLLGLIAFRLGMCFRNYVYTGEFGDITKSFTVGSMDQEKLYFKYILTGFHPAGILADTTVLLVVCMFGVFAWGAYAIGGLTILLAYVMRKRIAHKQTFIGNLKGDHLNE